MRNPSEKDLAAMFGLSPRPAKATMRPRLPATVALEVAPCDACLRRERCAVEKLACSQFEFFYLGATERRWRNAPRTDASRGKFITLFGKTP